MAAMKTTQSTAGTTKKPASGSEHGANLSGEFIASKVTAAGYPDEPGSFCCQGGSTIQLVSTPATQDELGQEAAIPAEARACKAVDRLVLA